MNWLVIAMDRARKHTRLNAFFVMEISFISENQFFSLPLQISPDHAEPDKHHGVNGVGERQLDGCSVIFRQLTSLNRDLVLAFTAPIVVAADDAVPNPRHGLDGIGQDGHAHLFVAERGIGVFKRLFAELRQVGVERQVGIRHQVGLVGDAVHVFEHVLAVAVLKGERAGGQRGVHFAEEAGLVWIEATDQRQTVAVVDEAGVVASVRGRAVIANGFIVRFIRYGSVEVFDLVIRFNEVSPGGFDIVVDGAAFFAEGTVIAVQRHVPVCDVVAQGKEGQREVIAGGGEGRPFLLAALDLEVIHHGVRQRLAAFGQVVLGVVVDLRQAEGGFLGGELELGSRGEPGEVCGEVVGVRGGFVLEDVRGTVVFEDGIGIPGSLDDSVTVIAEELGDLAGDVRVGVGDRRFLQAFDRFEGDPCVCKLVH
jgi:hypothetical protein